jgi:antitoxin component YwqK of YwqJK toxin-antitoxin module
MNSKTFIKDGIFYEYIDGILRRENPSKNGYARFWHANGQLALESPKVNGKNHGICREWHENGLLAKETPMEHGLIHGLVRQWNKEGTLLGEYRMVLGKGTEFEWNEDGTLKTQLEQVSENAIKGIVFDELRNPIEVFLWNGKPVSKKKFYERLNGKGKI